MKMRTNLLLKSVASVLAAGAVTVPAALGSGPSSPDTQDAAKAGPPATITDMRSPDTQEAAKASQSATAIDMQSPDTKDAANGRQFSPTVEVVIVAAPSRFDWLDAAVGASAALGASLIGVGALLLVQRRRKASVAVA